MSEASYALVFQGDILEGFERAQVMQRFGELFGLSAEEVAKVFGHPRVVFKRNLTHAAANTFRDRLLGIGMAVSVDAGPASGVAVPPAAGPAQSKVPPEPTVSPAAPAAAPVAAPPLGADELRVVPFRFSGDGFEFFRIWIVNILLSLVTLGVYSAWAKVRTQRYLHGNTRLDDGSFDYLADPLRILKGRLIAFALLVVYMLADQFVPLLGVVLMLAFIAILPWVMVRGIAFRNHNSAWRGVRFGFDGQLGEAYKVFLLWPMLGALSFGLLFPYALCRQQRFIIANSRYGMTPFTFGATPRGFYMAFLALLGVMLGGLAATALISMVLPVAAPVAMLAAYLLAFALFNVRFANLTYNNTALGVHRMAADYRLGSYAALMLTNTLAIVFTLGLFYPWAKVRSARYAADHIRVVAEGDLDEFAAAARDEVSALGGEIGDLFDVDLGI